MDAIDAILEIRSMGRNITTAEVVREWAVAFLVDPKQVLGLVETKESLQQQRAEVWSEDPGVPVFKAAIRMATMLNPDWMPEPTPYMGAGRTADHYSFQAADSIRRSLFIQESEVKARASVRLRKAMNKGLWSPTDL